MEAVRSLESASAGWWVAKKWRLTGRKDFEGFWITGAHISVRVLREWGCGRAVARKRLLQVGCSRTMSKSGKIGMKGVGDPGSALRGRRGSSEWSWVGGEFP